MSILHGYRHPITVISSPISICGRVKINYPATVLDYKKPPTAAELSASFATVVIENSGTGNPTLSATYPPNSLVTMVGQTASSSVSKTSNYPSAGLDSFRVSNVTITLSGTNSCASAIIVKADVWSSQANNDAIVHCTTPNQTFTISEVTVSGLVSCGSSRQFQVLVGSSWLTTMDFTYSVYADTDNSGGYSVSDPYIYSASGAVISATRYNSGLIPYTQYPGSNLSVVVFIAGHPVAATGLITNGCGAPYR